MRPMQLLWPRVISYSSPENIVKETLKAKGVDSNGTSTAGC